MRQKLVFIVILLLLVVCSRPSRAVVPLKRITVKLNKTIPSAQADDYFDVECIPLETSKSCLIGKVAKVVATDEFIFVFDDDQDNTPIFMFDRKGKFVRKIGRQGEGPGEYTQINDFEVHNGQVYALDDELNKILIYSFDGKFKSEIDLSEWGGADFHLTDSKDIVSYGNWYSILFWNRSGGLKKKLSLAPSFNKNMEFLKPFSWFGDSTFVHFFYNDTIYQVNNDQLIPRYFLDFGKYRFPLKDIANQSEFEERSSSPAYIIYQIVSVNSTFIFDYFLYDEHTMLMIYNRPLNQMVLLQDMGYKGISVDGPVGDYPNGTIYYDDAGFIYDYVCQVNKFNKKIKDPQKRAVILDLYKSVAMEDNPVLFILKEKSGKSSRL